MTARMCPHISHLIRKHEILHMFAEFLILAPNNHSVPGQFRALQTFIIMIDAPFIFYRICLCLKIQIKYDYYVTVISIWPLCLFNSYMVLIYDFDILCIRVKVRFFMFAVLVLYGSVCLRHQDDH